MVKSAAPPHQSLPGIASTVRRFYRITDAGNPTWQPQAAGETRKIFIYEPDMAVNADIKISVVWSSDKGSGSATFIPTYVPVTLDSDATAGVAGTAVDDAIGADTAATTANAVQETPQANIDPGSLTNGDAMLIQIELDAVATITLGTDIVDVYGVIVEYTRKHI